MSWKDMSSRNQKGEVYSESYELSSGDLRLVVHGLSGIPEQWFFSCTELDITQRDLRTKKIKTAKARAISQARIRVSQLNGWARKLTKLAKEPEA